MKAVKPHPLVSYGRQTPSLDVNGPVYWQTKLGEGKHNPLLNFPLSQVLHFPNWNLEMFELAFRRIFKGMEPVGGLL
jgi:hypothetical protein